MKTIQTLLLVVLVSTAVKSQPFEEYKKLNDAEKRLIEYKDDDRMLNLKVEHLATINQSRAKYNANPVKLDILASRVANKMALDAAKGKYMGHFNLKGEFPWHRYALAGGVDHVSENAAAISATADLENSDADIANYMREMHNAFMSEKAPNDGHKQTCIQPDHNFVGIGTALIRGEFRYYEEFVDRYLAIKEFSTHIKPGQDWSVAIKPLTKKHYLWAVLAYHQPFPKTMSARTISAIPSYDDYGKTLVHNLGPWEIPAPDSFGYTNLNFVFKQKGLYYLQIYLSDKPYTKGKASTEGKICASGIVVEVK